MAGGQQRRPLRRARPGGRVGHHQVADAPPTTPWTPSTPPSPPSATGPAPRRASAARSCAGPSSCSPSAPTTSPQLISLEMGKTVAEAQGRGDLRRRVLPLVRRGGGAGPRPLDAGPRRRQPAAHHRKPVGPCLFITPWNFPLAMGTRKIGPAVAAGCTMVVKPAAADPADDARAGRADGRGRPARRACSTSSPPRAPATVGAALMADDRLRKVSFTGSTEVGKVLVRQSADKLQRVSMELGGNAPFLVFEDADVDAAVDGAMIAKMRNMGEACTSANRFLVHESVAEEFADKLGDADGRADGRPRPGRRRRRRPADQRRRRRVGQRAGHRRGPRRRHAGHRRHARPTARATSTRRPCWSTYRPTPQINSDEIFGPVAPDHHLRHRGGGGRARQRHRVRPGVLRLHHATSPAPSGWPSPSSSAWSASTPGWSPTRPHRSAG